MKEKNTLLKSKVFLFLLLVNFFFHIDPIYSFDVDYYDTWTTSGSQYDKVLWKDATCPASNYYVTIGTYDTTYEPLGYCVNNDRLSDTNYDFCIVKNSTAYSDCSGLMPLTPVTSFQSSSSWSEADNVNRYQDVLCGEDGNVYSQGSVDLRRAQIQYWCDTGSGCQSCGISANSNAYDYYIVDKTAHACLSDGASSYQTRAYYTSTSWVLTEVTLCTSGTICDSDHDGVFSYSATTLPTSPCKTDIGGFCSVSSDCWNNEVCNGATTKYRGICDSQLVDIDRLNYLDSCGGSGSIGSINVNWDGDNSCEIDGGFPSGYRCDETLDNGVVTSIGAVYNAVCKGGEGNSCTDDADCYNDFDCISGFCAYDSLAVISDLLDPNKEYKDQDVYFYPTGSVASDNDIKYACWNINNDNIECDGDVTQCTNECSGASYNNANWENGFIHNFTQGGTYTIKLTIGSSGKYSDDETTTYCISGDNTYCWSCSDNIKNDDELYIDWGGHCGLNYFARCNNNILDNVTNETSIDYGGLCGQCDNSSVELDESLIFLKQSNLLTYPFTQDLCDLANNTKDGIVMFVFVLSLILLVPILFLILLLVVLISFLTTGIGTGIFAISKKIGKKLYSKWKKKK